LNVGVSEEGDFLRFPSRQILFLFFFLFFVFFAAAGGGFSVARVAGHG
jgi:hypothetical protein